MLLSKALSNFTLKTVGLISVPALLTVNSKIFSPAIKPSLIVKGTKSVLKLGLLAKYCSIPLSVIVIPSSSVCHSPSIKN